MSRIAVLGQPTVRKRNIPDRETMDVGPFVVEDRFSHHVAFDYEYEYVYRFTEYEYDCPDERIVFNRVAILAKDWVAVGSYSDSVRSSEPLDSLDQTRQY